MERIFKEKDIKPNELSPLTLAFIGDTVFDLFVRESVGVNHNFLFWCVAISYLVSVRQGDGKNARKSNQSNQSLSRNDWTTIH